MNTTLKKLRFRAASFVAYVSPNFDCSLTKNKITDVAAFGIQLQDNTTLVALKFVAHPLSEIVSHNKIVLDPTQ